ncbi:MAG: Calx-beta domain-containing protein [Candidatus Sulfotelmatobacter sp.]
MPRILSKLLFCFLLSAPFAFASTPQTFLSLNSQPGDYVGQGIQQTFTPSEGTFVFQAVNGVIEFSFYTPDYSQTWDGSFEPPVGQTLVKGIYEYAQRFHYTKPGLSVDGDGRGCNTDTGRFYVSDIAISSGGVLERLAIDFEQHCEGAVPSLYGSVRYNSTVTAVPRVSVAKTDMLKGDAGTNGGTAIVSLSMPSTQTVTVQFETADGTAHAGQDYVSTSGTIQFEPGTTWQIITIPIVGDQTWRGNPTFGLKLFAASGAPLGIAAANVQILDPNANMTALAMSSQSGDYIGQGGIYLLTIDDAIFTAAANYDNGVSVTLQGLNPWALDFAAPNNATLTASTYDNAQGFPFQSSGFPGLSIYGAGRGCDTITGNFVVNQIVFGSSGTVEHFSADAEQHCEGATQALFASIRINAPMRQISVSDAVIDHARSTAVFTVTLHPSSKTPASLNFATADGTALSGVDYVSTNQTLTFPAGVTSLSVSVPLLISPDGGKAFYGQLSSPSGASLWIAQGAATF